MNVTSIDGAGDPTRAVDIDLYVDLLVMYHGFNRREAELEARRECVRDGVKMVRKRQYDRPCLLCNGAKIIGGMRYYATGTLTDARPCPRCVVAANDLRSAPAR